MPARTSARAVRAFVDDLERRLAPIDQGILRAEWGLAMGRGPGNLRTLHTRRHRLLGDPSALDRTRRYRGHPVPDRVARRLEILERAILACQIEEAPDIADRRDRLSRAIAAFRPRWRGRRVGREVVRRAFRRSPDRRERERAYRAEDPLYRPLEAELRTLAVLRNERARALGFRSFPEFRLSLEGFTVARLESLIQEAVRYVPREMRRRRAEFEERSGESGWFPWDLRYSHEVAGGLPDRLFPGASMLGEVVRAVRRWGFPDRMFQFRVDRHDLSSGGLCLAPDPPADVRVIVHPGGGWQQYGALFHEVGHALASRSVRQPTHLLRWHEHLPGFAGLAEGEGRFFEQIAVCEPWLRDRPGISPSLLQTAVERRPRVPLLAVSNLGEWILQELALFRDPAGDPNAERVRFARRVFGYDDFRPTSFADSFLVELPLYTPSYLYAELLRPQLAATALADVGGELWPNPRLGPWLVDRWFRDGSSYDWWVRLRELSGRPFGARAFNAEMRAAGG